MQPTRSSYNVLINVVTGTPRTHVHLDHPAILNTVLGHLASHFLEAADGDLPTARHAANRMLAAYDVQTEEELHLATDIIGFGFHALEALSAAAAPDLSLNQKIRLRGSAVSLNREAHRLAASWTNSDRLA